jgi:iron complex outermembrane receptor protein
MRGSLPFKLKVVKQRNKLKLWSRETYMFTNSKLAKSIRLAMAVGVVSTTMIASTAAVAQETQTAEKEAYEKISITGSRIQRTDMEGALPISVISREDLEASGEVSLGEVLRNFAGNSQGSFTPRSGSSAQSSATVNLRGLGSNRTLVLLDGRRMPSDALGGGSGQNLSLVPLAAVERIEILREGASAIYGSEAIGGVVNIILRKDYEGLEFNVRAAEPSREGGGTEDVYSVVGGISSDRGNITFAAEHRETTPLFANQRASTAANSETLGTGYSNNSDPANYRVTDFFKDGTNVQGFWRPDPQCPSERVRPTPGIVLTNPTTSESVTGEHQQCRFPFANVASWLPGFKNSSLFVQGNFEVTDNLQVFAKSTFTRLESYARYAPIPLVSGFGLTVAADDPLNPTVALGDPQEVLTQWRPQALGNRDFEVETYQMDFQTGFNYSTDLGILSVVGQVGKQDSSDTTRNLVLFDSVFAQIEEGNVNPFGTPEQVAAAADTFRADSFREAEIDSETLNIDWAGDFGVSFLDNEIAYAVGFEFRSEDFAETYDPLTRTGGIFGSTGGPSGGGRDSRSYYFEVAIPVTDDIEISYAGRQEAFSLPDTSEYTQSAKITWDVTEDILLRASYTEGFRVPDIDTLLQTGGDSTDQAIDRLRCSSVGNDQANPLCQTGEISAIRQPGAATEPEFSETFNLGVVWNATEDLSVTADYYQIEINEQISFLSTQAVLDLEATGADPGQFGVGVNRTGQGEIIEVLNGFANLPGFETTGLDLNVSYVLRDTPIGDFRVLWDFFYVNSFDSESAPGLGVFDNVGYVSTPEYRSNIALNWMLDDFSANVTFNHTAGYDARSPEDEFLNDITTEVGALPSYTTIDASVTYVAPWATQFTLGARNLGDKLSATNNHAFGNGIYDRGLGDILGRVVYMSARHKF